MDLKRLSASIGRTWDDSITERLIAYVRIPNKSPLFDPEWEQHGYMEQAITLMADWCRAQPLPGARVEVRRLPGKTPLLLVDIPGELPGSVLLYGHLDKQPEFTGWLEGLGPWQPVLRDGKLYGRGAADDGYAVFSSLTAIAALKEQRVRLPRCVVLIEACEESGSVDLPAHLEALGGAIGEPSLVVCLDAECGNYEQVWCTTSLRGNLVGTLRVRVLTEGVHSGMATGIAPTPFRILEQLLARLENPVTGDLLLEELHVTMPADRRAQASLAARVLGDEVAGRLPWIKGAHALSNDPAELIINNTWRATLAVTGAEGLPPLQSAGNVLLPEIACKLSLRLPPTCDADRATHAVREALEREPPYGAQVSFTGALGTGGWNAPAFAPWLEESITRASRAVYNRDAVHIGCGGTIPFMGMLGERFPRTQFFITGVLGPHANAHGPNEFLHVDYAKRLTVCVSLVLSEHAQTLAR
ncbi:MAG TPA: M20/M25/M40 family metallo-hydrolase [Steroidobacteraceae bacterium]|nr:M20/M25/M40 family metallo-hydrolase [Steroidobacteraceae bacterium]